MPQPSLEFELQAGLYTKARQDDVSALLTATNVDYYTVAGGVGKVPGTMRRSDTASPANAWHSLHHHEGYLSGTLTKMQVGLNGTQLLRIGTDQTLLLLQGGMTAEPLFGVSSQDRLHLASFFNAPLKVTLDNVVSLWGIAPPTATATATVGASGNVDPGTHRYVVTYVTTYGKESNRSDPSNTVQTTSSQVSLTNIPVSPEAQVVSRKIYRDDGGDALYRLVATISDNTTTTYTDNSSNADLGSTPAPEPASSIDNSTPENMVFVFQFDAYIFGVLASDRRTIMWTEANEPEYWPTLNARTFPSEITAGIPILGGALIFGTDWTVAITGGEGGSRTIQFNETNPELGCVGPRCVTRAKQAILTIHDDGPHLTTNGEDDWYLGTPIRDQIDDALTVLPFTLLVYDRSRFRVLWLLFDQALIYNYGNLGTGDVSPEGSGVDPLDLRKGKWSRLDLPDSVLITSVAAVETDADLSEIWLGSSNGVVYRITTESANFAVGSVPNAITATIETTFEKLFQDDEKRGLLTYLIVKGSGDAASTWSVTLTMAEDAGGPEGRSTTFDVQVGPGVTSRKYKVPRGMEGAYCKFAASNAVLGETGVIESARIKFVARPARGVR